MDDDPDDQINQATSLGTVTQTQIRTDTIDSSTDVDIYSITVVAGQRISFDIDQTSGLDSYLRLFNGGGAQLAAINNASGPGETSSQDSYLDYTFTSSGTYYIGVSGNGNTSYDAISGTGDSSGSTGAYTLVVSPGLAGTIRPPGETTDYLVDILRYGSTPGAINPNQRTWIVTHGWNSSRVKANIDAVASSLAETRPNDQVLTLDWSSAANTGILNPFDAENSIPYVAQWAAAALTNYGFSGTNLNLVGHSFGSYVSDEIAQRFPGGVNTIVTLDPAADIIGGYDPISNNQVNFARDSQYSWSFHASSLGNEYTPATADAAFIVESGLDSLSAHGNVVFLFAYMLSHPDDVVGQYFLLSYLLAATPGPWLPNQYVSSFSGDAPVQGYEGVIQTMNEGRAPQSIQFVDNAAPLLGVTSFTNGQVVAVNSITITGTATDSTRGSHGIASVFVNGVRANNDTASGTGVANWSRTLNLSAGANAITVVARDSSTNQIAVTNVLTIIYSAILDPPTLSIAFSSSSVTLSWHADYSDFALQQTDKLISLGTWSAVSQATAVIGSSNVVVVPISQTRQFFRLRKP